MGFGQAFMHGGAEYAVVSIPLSRPAAFASLTPAELAVAEGVLDGLSMRELAAARAVSARTIGNQLAQVYRKLGIVSRHELVAMVAQHAGSRRA
jgi:DNA-binding CsgD family transcriptional regulator